MVIEISAARKLWTNPNTGKGWTDVEEATFATIMRIARMGRIAAIQFFRSCRSDHAKALKLAQDNYGLSDAQKAAYESTRAARLAGLSKARQARHAIPRFQQTEHAA